MKGQASRSEDGAGEGGMGSEWQEQTWGDLATLEYGKALRGYQNASPQHLKKKSVSTYVGNKTGC